MRQGRTGATGKSGAGRAECGIQNYAHRPVVATRQRAGLRPGTGTHGAVRLRHICAMIVAYAMMVWIAAVRIGGHLVGITFEMQVYSSGSLDIGARHWGRRVRARTHDQPERETQDREKDQKAAHGSQITRIDE